MSLCQVSLVFFLLLSYSLLSFLSNSYQAKGLMICLFFPFPFYVFPYDEADRTPFIILSCCSVVPITYGNFTITFSRTFAREILCAWQAYILLIATSYITDSLPYIHLIGCRTGITDFVWWYHISVGPLLSFILPCRILGLKCPHPLIPFSIIGDLERLCHRRFKSSIQELQDMRIDRVNAQSLQEGGEEVKG